MHTGYDSYWMCNSQTTVPNLQGNGSLSDCTSLKSFTHIQDGRQTSHSKDFISIQKGINQDVTSQNILSYPQKTSQYDWTSMAAQSSNPYNYQNMGACLQQKDSRVYWRNFGPQHLDNRNTIGQPLNYNICQKTQLLEDQCNKSTAQLGRIRVRDVNSLNSIAGSSVPGNCTLERQFDKYFNGAYNINQRQLNPAQKNNVEHSQYVPTLLEANSFQPSLQNPPTAPKPSRTQNRFANAYPKPREQTSQGDQYHLNNIRRNESSYKTSYSVLQELLGAVNQVGGRRPAETPQNVQTMNSRLNVPPNDTTKDSNLTFSYLLEDNYTLGQPSYRNPPSYPESSQRAKVTPVSQGNAFEPISPPSVEKDINSEESSLRVTAVISLPEWCNGLALNTVSVPFIGDCNLLPVTESTKEGANPEIPKNDPPSVVSNDTPNGCLRVKEEPMSSSEFLPDNMTEIMIQTMKTEDYGGQEESASQNNEQIRDKTPGKGTTVTNNSSNNSNCKNNNNNDDKNQILDKTSADPSDEIPAEKFPVRVEAKDNGSKESSDTSEVKSESNYKSKINRDKLDLLIEFLNGSDKHADYVSEQSHPEKFKKQRKVDGSANTKSNKSNSSEKSKNSVRSTPSPISNKVTNTETSRCPSNLQATKNEDTAKNAPIKTEKKEHDPANPTLKNESIETGNVDKGKPKNDTKKPNPTDCVLCNQKETQDNRSKESPESRNYDSKKSKPERKEKMENKSISLEDQMTKIKPESAEKSRNPEITKQKSDADVRRSETRSEVEDSFQANQRKLENLLASDVNQNENPKVNHTTEIEKTGLRVVSDPVSSIKEEMREFKKERGHAQKNVECEGKPKGTRIDPNLKYQFCENCFTVSPIECFWINVMSGEVKCSNCFKKMNLDSVKANHKSPGDNENVEIKTKKGGGDGKIQSPDRRNNACSESEEQTNQKVVSKSSSETSYDKKSQRRHSTGKEELRREKRKSLDENLFHERKKKRRNSEEKHDKKAQEQISETNKSTMQGVPECSKTDTSVRKSLSKDRSQSPRKEERPRMNSSDQKDEDSSTKGVYKTDSSNPEAGKKGTYWTEDPWPRKGQAVEGKEEDKCSRKSMGILEALKQWERRRTKHFRSPMDAEKKRGAYNKPNPMKFSWGTDLLKENQFTKVQNPSEGFQDRREKQEYKKRNERGATGSANEHWERKKRTINGPLQYKDFVLKKSPVFTFSDTIKRGRFTDILEEVDPGKRNRKCNGER